jgi:hypothetical protein
VNPQYSLRASTVHPQLVIFLCDFGAGYGNELTANNLQRCLFALMQDMLQKSTKGQYIKDRYHIALYGYGDVVKDLLHGIQPLLHTATSGQWPPNEHPMKETRTAEAFIIVEQTLYKYLHRYAECPAPLIRHLTTGRSPDGTDPASAVARIKQLHVQDGNALIQNIICSDWPKTSPILDIKTWPGVTDVSQVSGDFARQLFAMSSQLPDSRHRKLIEQGYHIDPKAIMLWPGAYPKLAAGCLA